MRTRIAIFLHWLLRVLQRSSPGRVDPTAAGMDAGGCQNSGADSEVCDDGKAAGFVALVRGWSCGEFVAVGFQDREAKTPMRIDSMFQIMSMTKPVTCHGNHDPDEEGRLSLVDPVEKYLPEFAGQKMYGGAKPSRLVTVRDLMTHTSGCPAGREGM